MRFSSELKKDAVELEEDVLTVPLQRHWAQSLATRIA